MMEKRPIHSRVLAHPLVVSDLILVILSIQHRGYCKCIMLVQGTDPDEAKVAKVEVPTTSRSPHPPQAQEPTYPMYPRLSRPSHPQGTLVVDGSAAVVNWPVCTRFFIVFRLCHSSHLIQHLSYWRAHPNHLHPSQPDHPKTCMHCCTCTYFSYIISSRSSLFFLYSSHPCRHSLSAALSKVLNTDHPDREPSSNISTTSAIHVPGTTWLARS